MMLCFAVIIWGNNDTVFNKRQITEQLSNHCAPFVLGRVVLSQGRHDFVTAALHRISLLSHHAVINVSIDTSIWTVFFTVWTEKQARKRG